MYIVNTLLVGEAKQQLEFYRDELMKKTEENCNKKDEITGLLAQIVDLQKKSKTVSIVYIYCH